jgi:thiol-disulfide isomerase/thioredoxin
MAFLRRSPRTSLAAALTTGAAVVAGCGAGDRTGDAPVAAPEVSSAPVPPAGADDEVSGATVDDATTFASVFAATSPIDADFDATSLAGRDSVLWFWAPWCTACRAEAPDITATVGRFGDEVQVIGVAGHGGLDDMRDFIDDTGTTGMTHVADPDGRVWSAFGIFAQPAFAFIDDGGEVETFVGGLPADDLADRVELLLAT